MFKSAFFMTFLWGGLVLIALAAVPAPLSSKVFLAETVSNPLTDTIQPTTPNQRPSAQKLPYRPPVKGSRIKQKPATETQLGSEGTVKSKTGFSHTAWDSLLQKYVSATGKVNYKELKANRGTLDAYCRLLAENTPQEAWAREEKLAYWINAYNAFTMKLIVDNYPISSIQRLDGGKPWAVKRITLGGKKYSLDQIENEIIRPQFHEPRIHFAINCAAKSCPPLYNHAFTAENLSTTLEIRTRRFINNPNFNTLTADKISVSKIFDWYGADFGDLKAFLNHYAAKPLSPSATITFTDYDWNLNE